MEATMKKGKQGRRYILRIETPLGLLVIELEIPTMVAVAEFSRR